MVPLLSLSSSGTDCHTFAGPDISHIVILDFEYIENRDREELVIVLFVYALHLASSHRLALQKHFFGHGKAPFR